MNIERANKGAIFKFSNFEHLEAKGRRAEQ
jgi:hypothetical protein